MARYTKAKTRINRRFGQVIFPAKRALEKKPYPPGIHGPRLRRKVSDYSLGLNEKQKLRYMYGLMERQFRTIFERAKKCRGVTGEIFLQLLETRLDSVVYRLGFAKTRSAARQFLNHGHITVNGRVVDIPSFTCRSGDEVGVRERTSSRQLATRSLEDAQYRNPPAWITLGVDSLKGTVNRLPTRDEMEQGINEQLIVEYYSR